MTFEVQQLALGINVPAELAAPPARGRTIEFVVAGQPHGKDRPRFARRTGHAYTPKETQLAEARVERAWEDAGSVQLEGPIAVVVLSVLDRPQAHRRVDGSLSALGERTPYPMRTPDVDNALKLVMDALSKGRAFRNDSQVVQALLVRRWAAQGEAVHMQIAVRELLPPPPPQR